jgi:hypothetical protein
MDPESALSKIIRVQVGESEITELSAICMVVQRNTASAVVDKLKFWRGYVATLPKGS